MGTPSDQDRGGEEGQVQETPDMIVWEDPPLQRGPAGRQTQDFMPQLLQLTAVPNRWARLSKPGTGNGLWLVKGQSNGAQSAAAALRKNLARRPAGYNFEFTSRTVYWNPEVGSYINPDSGMPYLRGEREGLVRMAALYAKCLDKLALKEA